jgi:hypothetical protein
MDGLRRAALALSTLTERDRRWMLDRLPAPQRDGLSPLLHELGGLGLVADPDLHQRLRDEENRQLAAAMADGDALAEAAMRRLDAHAPAVVAQVLADESDVAVAALAARFPWRWSAPVLQMLEPQRRSRIARLMPVARTMQGTPWRLLVRAVCNRADLTAEAFGGAA